MYESNTAENSSYCPVRQHLHEIAGSTLISDTCDPHNHRFAAISDEAIPYQGSHVHNVKFRTDSYDGHYHEFCGVSSPAIPVGDGRHVHFATGCTTFSDGHAHKFRFASLINDPIECK